MIKKTGSCKYFYEKVFNLCFDYVVSIWMRFNDKCKE